jgi:iron(III) transport system substrate-binding protein
MVTFMKAEREGLLDRYIPSWDTAVARDGKSPDGFWYGTFLTPEVIFYNSRIVPPGDAPADWDDLLDPRWRGRIIIRSPLASGTMRMIFSVILQRAARSTGREETGFEWLRRLDANTKTYVADPTQLYLRIAREEGAVSLWNLPDVVIQRDLYGYPFAYVIPRSGTPVITDGIAVVRGARHRDAAVRVYEFVTSPASLILQARRFTRIPVRRDIPPDSLPPWMAALDISAMEVDWDEVAQKEMAWMKTWDETVKGRGQSMSPGH